MDFVELLGNLLLITFFGLFLAFNPMLIVVDMFLVLKSRQPIKNTLLLIAGFATSITLLFILFSNIINPNSEISIRKLETSLSVPPIIDILCGTLLVLAAIKYRSRPSIVKKSTTQAISIPRGSLAIYSFSLIKSFLSLTNLFAVLALAKLYAINSWNMGIGAVALCWLLLVGVIPIIFIVYLHYFKHESLLAIDKRVNRFLARDTNSLIAAGVALIGIVFVLKGLLDIF